MPRATLVSAAIGLFFSSLPAQSTLTVGPGGMFANLPPAVAAAQDGDLILVAPGGYSISSSLVINKDLRILGGPGRQLFGPTNATLLWVSGLPSNKTFMLDGFTLFSNCPGGFHTSVVKLTANTGVVHLANLTVYGKCPFVGGGNCDSYLWFQGCSHVTMTRCQVIGLEVNSDNSRLTMTQCNVVGRAAWGVSYGLAATSGLFSLGSQAFVTQSVLRGGAGDGGFPGGSGIAAHGASVVVAGDSNSIVAAGQPGATSALASAVSLSFSAFFEIDGAVQLQPNPSASPFAYVSPATVVTSRPVALTSGGGTVGNTIDFGVRTQSGEALFLFGGLPITQPVQTGLGPVWTDPTQVILLAAAVQGASELYTTSIAVPNVPALRGELFAFYALAGASTLPWRLSSLSTIMLQ
ncbi:MAG TPA: hypothetical protein VF384_11330 [Planctomycetota bacterium]